MDLYVATCHGLEFYYRVCRIAMLMSAHTHCVSPMFTHHSIQKRAALGSVGVECASTERQEGFTLLEMAVVIIIIGLIVAALMVGRDMIITGRLRGTAGEYSAFNTALVSFYNKYNYLPGDIPCATAQGFGLSYVAACAAGQGDGDGHIGLPGSLATAEGLLFWSDLSQYTPAHQPERANLYTSRSCMGGNGCGHGCQRCRNAADV